MTLFLTLPIHLWHFIVVNTSDIAFWKHLLLGGMFFILTPIVLGISFFTLFTISKSETTSTTVAAVSLPADQVKGVQIFASLPDAHPGITGKAEVSSARVEIIKQYLREYESPLYDYSELLVKTSEEYGLDFRLLTAIAQQESNLCKRIPEGTHNCWGWGIHSRGTLGFESYEQAIETVSQGLKDAYVDQGFSSPEEIMSKYTPHSPEGAWARGVTQFLDEMK